MFNFLKNLSLLPKGLKYKTIISFSLMSVIPLLICVWLVTNYIFPNIGFLGLSLGNLSFILAICIFISLLGFYIAKEMIDPVVKIALDAREIAEGDVDKVIDVKREDEIGDLSASLNIMTQKIKENIDELKVYGERTKLINIEINKKVLALSSLLQIGNLISSSAELSAILNFITQKMSSVEDDSLSIVMLLDERSNEFKVASSCNLSEDKVQKFKIQRYIDFPQIMVVDKDNPPRGRLLNTALLLLDLRNLLLIPIVVSRKPLALLLLGNAKEGFEFKDDEQELLKLFAKQITIAIENDILIKRAKELAIKDEMTGLYNEGYIRTRLDEEIKRSRMYQRPCGYLLVDIDGFKNLYEELGESKTEALLKAVGELLKGAVTEVDKVAHLEADRFAVVLPERNKKQAANIAEDLRKKIEVDLAKLIKTSQKVTVSVGVSENPIDGSSADELMQKALELVTKAKSLGKNRVAV